jgi:ketosteroid isomerase-like protein
VSRADEVRERLLAGFERWNQGALGDVERLWHEDLVWEEAPLFPDSGRHEGRDACVARMQERFDLVGTVKLEVVDLEVRELVLIEVIVRGEGTLSGVPAEGREYFVWRLADDNRVLHWREFFRREDAEAALREAR